MKRKAVMSEKGVRRQYDAEFKASAVEMMTSGRSVGEVSRALGVNENVLRKWKSGASSAPAPSDQGELERLRKQVRQLEIERDILKKALSIFSRPG